MSEFAENCCCSPTGITGMPGGIHPDHIQTVQIDAMPDVVGNWGTRTQAMTYAPIHILGGTLSVYSNFPPAGNPIPEGYANFNETMAYAYTPLNVSLFTITGFTHDTKDYGGYVKPGDEVSNARNDARVHIWTGCLNPGGGTPSLSLPPHLWGYFCDGGLYVETQSAALTTVGCRICIQYIDRINFTPAYAPPIDNNKTRWACMNPGEDFLDGFYGGVIDDPGDPTDQTTGETPPSEPSNPDSSWDVSSIGSYGSDPTGWSLA